MSYCSGQEALAHASYEHEAREHHRTIETGNHGMIAWAGIGYEIGDRHTAAVAYRDRGVSLSVTHTP